MWRHTALPPSQYRYYYIVIVKETQLKSLAKTTEALNEITTISNNTFLTFGEREEALIAIGKNYTTETLRAAIAQSTLKDKQIETILSANGLQGELLKTTTDELANSASTNALAASQAGATDTTIGLGTAFTGPGIAIKKSSNGYVRYT